LDNIDVRVEYEFEPGQRGRLYGPPEDCYEEIAPEVTVLTVFLNGAWVDAESLAPAVLEKWRETILEAQAELTLECAEGFVPRPGLSGLKSSDEDLRIADLQYRDVFEFAVGHNVSATTKANGRNCHVVSTAWIPTAHVELVEAASITGVELSMEALAGLADHAAAQRALKPMAVSRMPSTSTPPESVSPKMADPGRRRMRPRFPTCQSRLGPVNWSMPTSSPTRPTNSYTRGSVRRISTGPLCFQPGLGSPLSPTTATWQRDYS
jgi:hypothetical protein